MSRRLAWLPVALGIVTPPQMSGQISLSVGAGLRQGSTMVHDFIVAPIDIRPGLAPSIVVSGGTRLDRRWTIEMSVDYSSATLYREESGSSHEVVGTGAVAGRLELRRPLTGPLSAGLAIGAIKYLPQDEVGIFRDGAGPISALGSLSLRYHAPFVASRRFALEARYDLHRFTTPALQDAGFAGGSTVHRVGLFVIARVTGPRS
jgi:hypothetical protein